MARRTKIIRFCQNCGKATFWKFDEDMPRAPENGHATLINEHFRCSRCGLTQPQEEGDR